MQAISNKDILNYTTAQQNVLATAVGFVYTPGSGYTSAPTVAFSGGGGSGAAGTAVLTNGRVTGITITAGGTGYTTAPTIAFTGGGGSGAAATAVLTSTAVSSATITSGGSGQKLVVTDLTAYPAGDSRLAVNITVADKFGKLKDTYHLNAGTAAITIDLLADGFNTVDGIDSLVTVVSLLNKVKDGSVYGIGDAKLTGNYVMEY